MFMFPSSGTARSYLLSLSLLMARSRLMIQIGHIGSLVVRCFRHPCWLARSCRFHHGLWLAPLLCFHLGRRLARLLLFPSYSVARSDFVFPSSSAARSLSIGLSTATARSWSLIPSERLARSHNLILSTSVARLSCFHRRFWLKLPAPAGIVHDRAIGKSVFNTAAGTILARLRIDTCHERAGLDCALWYAPQPQELVSLGHGSLLGHDSIIAVGSLSADVSVSSHDSLDRYDSIENTGLLAC